MKRTYTRYFCDVCREEIEQWQTQDDWTGRNWGLCDACCEKGYAMRAYPITESDGLVVRIEQPEKETSND